MHGKSSSLKAELGSPAASRFLMRRVWRSEVSRVGVGRPSGGAKRTAYRPPSENRTRLTESNVINLNWGINGHSEGTARPTPTLDTSRRNPRRMGNLDAAGLPNSAFRLLDFPCIVDRLHGLRRTIYRDDAACRSRGGNNSGARRGGVSGSS